MWVFAYGSLMSDGWERPFGGTAHPGAVLDGYRRSFNKLSTLNWGTAGHPCPTLGLEPDPAGRCVGSAFAFDPGRKRSVREYLRSREGRTFDLVHQPVRLGDGSEVEALVAVNRLDTPAFAGDLPLEERAALAVCARGTSGTGIEYVRGARRFLAANGIADPEVEAMAEAVERLVEAGAPTGG